MQVESQVPMPGGNIKELQLILKGSKAPEAEEFTMVQWDHPAMEIILLNLLQEWERVGMQAAILSDKTCRVGMSFKPHKKVQNIF